MTSSVLSFEPQVLASDDDNEDSLIIDPDELIDSEEGEGISGDEEDEDLTYVVNPSQLQVALREKLFMEIPGLLREKAIISQKLTESEAENKPSEGTLSNG